MATKAAEKPKGDSALAVAVQGSELVGLPLKSLAESGRNPRKSYPPEAQREMVESIKRHGVLDPLIVRPMDEKGEIYEILCGSRRYRAAKEAGLEAVPCRVVQVDDDDAFEIMVVENVQRQDVHPIEEAEGFAQLLKLSNGDYLGVAVKTGKERAYIAKRLKLLDLTDKARKLFLDQKMSVDHAVQLARLPEEEQKQLLTMFGSEEVPTLASLRRWIEENVMLELGKAPWDKADKTLVPKAGSCVECPKRTGCAKDLFNDVKAGDRCTDGACFKMKMQAHIDRIQRELEAKGHKVVGLWSAYQSKVVKGTIQSGHYTVVDPKRKVKPCDKVVKGIFLDGPVAGVSVDVCPDDTCAFHMNRTYQGRDPGEREKNRKEALRQKREREVGARMFRGLFESGKASPTTEDLRHVASFAFDRLWHDAKGRVVKALGWTSEKKGGAQDFSHVEKRIEKMEGDEVGRFLVALSLSQDLDPRWTKGGTLKAFAKRYGVDVEGIEKSVDADLTKKKSATRKKTTPAKEGQAKAAKKPKAKKSSAAPSTGSEGKKQVVV